MRKYNFFSKSVEAPDDKPAPLEKKVVSPSGLMTIKGVFDRDIDSEVENRLRGDLYKFEFRKMGLNDPICGSILLVLTKIFQATEWKCMDDDDNILRDSLAEVNWQERIEDVCTQFIYGHNVMEVTMKEREDGSYIWGSMHYRPQTTLSDWKYDKHGKLVTIQQQGLSGNVVDIPAKKCLLFTTTKTQVNPLGKSLFRNAYRSWYYKTNYEQVEAMGIERDLTGLPVLTAPENCELTDDKGALNAIGQWSWNTVRSIKRNSQEGLVLPPGWEVKLIGSPGNRQFDMNLVIDRYSANIAMSMLSQFLILGVVNSSGSFALAKEQKDLFNRAVEGFAATIANVINTQFIGVPALVALNGLKKRPYVKPVGISKPNLTELAGFLGRLLKFNVLTPDDVLEEYLRNEAAMPSADPKSARKIEENKPVKEVQKKKKEDSEDPIEEEE